MAVAVVNDSAAPWVSVTELARLKGVSPAAISKRVKRLREQAGLKTTGEGRTLRINLAHFDRLVGETSDPAQELRNPSGRARETEQRREPADQGGYNAARTQRESYQAEMARLDLDERVGKLCLREEVEAATFDVFRRLRDRVRGIPAAIAERVAAAPDSRAVRTLLDQEIREVLTLLAEELDQANADDETGEGEDAG